MADLRRHHTTGHHQFDIQEWNDTIMRIHTTSLIFGATLLAPALEAQVQERTLSLDLSYPEEFSSIGGLLELEDDNILVSDPLSNVLIQVDVRAGRSRQIGREGEGPEEYNQPDGLFKMPGDSILMVDLQNGRLTMLGPDFGFGRTHPIAEQTEDGMLVLMPSGADRDGMIYLGSTGMGIRRPNMNEAPDSGAVVRFDLRSGVVDTVTSFKLQGSEVQRVGGGIRMTSLPLTPQDAWAVASDGRVAVARSQPYRMEWYHPDGNIIRGESVEFRPQHLGDREKYRWAENRNRNGLRMTMQIGGSGARSLSMSRGGGGSNEVDLDTWQWPERMPAFTSGSVIVSQAGNAWVRRLVRAGQPELYEVFGADGNLRDRVRLPEGREVLEISSRYVYTIHYDEFDLVWLERYNLN